MNKLFSFVSILVTFVNTDCSQDITSINQNDLNFSNHSDDLNNLVPFNCFSNVTLDCLRSGISKMMARLESRTPLEIVPGLSLTWDLPNGQKLTPSDVFNFDSLLKAVNTYLGSISLKIQLLDEAVLSKGARSLEQIFQSDNSTEVGRKRKDQQQSGLLGLAMAMKASMMSMVMAGVAAISGKALMVSMMALAFAALSALKGHGEKSTTYEIKQASGHHGHYRRSFNEQEHYEKSAFNGYKDTAQ